MDFLEHTLYRMYVNIHVVFETDDRLMGVITVVTVSNGHSSVMYVERVYKNSVKPIFSKGRQRPDNCEQVQVHVVHTSHSGGANGT